MENLYAYTFSLTEMITPAVTHYLQDLTLLVIALSLQPELGMKKRIVRGNFSPRSTYQDKAFQSNYFVPTPASRKERRLTFLFAGK